MTIPKWLHSELQRAIDALDEGSDGEELEPDFTFDDDSWEVQLKKACRMLEVSKKALDKKDPLFQSKYYTLCIETAFASLERTLQAYLLKKEFMAEDEQIEKHTTCFEKAGKAGIFDERATVLIIELWGRNRSRLYYRHDLPSRKAAHAVQSLAEKIHEYVIGADQELKSCCICKR